MSTPMMACGHAANAVDKHGAPCCVVCFGVHPGANTVADAPDLTGRTAKCAYRTCNSEQPSSPDLAFFEHTPDKAHDRFYCGCFGWD